MQNWTEFLNKVVASMGFSDFKVEFDEEHRHGRIFIYDNPNLIRDNLPLLVDSFSHLMQLVAQKHKEQPIFIDINNYRKERETLIIELAKAAARKATQTKEPVSLPSMNSYERRIVHMELAAHPEVATESQDSGKDRFVIVKPIL